MPIPLSTCCVIEGTAAVKQFRQIHPKPTTNASGSEPRWEGSKAEEQLKTMVQEEKHVGKTPAEIRAGNAEFQKYDLKTLRNHIYQEQRSIKFKAYVEHKSDEKEKTMQKERAKAQVKIKKEAGKRKGKKEETNNDNTI